MAEQGHPIQVGRGGSRTEALRRETLVFQSVRGLLPEIRLLIEAFPARVEGRILVGRDAGGVLALAAHALWPDAAIADHHFDAYVGRGASLSLAQNHVDSVLVQVEADLPAGPFGLVALPFPAGEDALLGRELLEQAHDALEMGGRLLASTNRTHHWLLKVVKEVFGKANLQGLRPGKGAVIAARRTLPASRQRPHAHRIRVTRGSRTLDFLTRPGLFSHGRLDKGTSALLDSFVAAPGQRVLDLGCGAGVLGLAAAIDAGPSGIVLVDSNARATAVARTNAETNDLAAATVCLRADLEDLPGAPFDLVLANPPYFTRGRIARAFTDAAARTLHPRGQVKMVAKSAALHRAILEERFHVVKVESVRGYAILTAKRPRSNAVH